MERLLSIDEVANLLGVSKATIYSWTHKNTIPHIKLSNSLLRFRESEIAAWIEQRVVAPVPAKTGKENPVRHRAKSTGYRDDQIDHIVKEAIKKFVR